MAERTPPLYLQGGSHTAINDRRAIARRASYGGTLVEGVFANGDLKVTANGTPNMTVNVAAGAAIVAGTEASTQGAYEVDNDASVSLAIAAADGTNPRRDLIVARVRDAAYPASATNTWALEVVTGTPAASPADPTLPANSYALARVAVAAGATTITSGNITDLRDYNMYARRPQGRLGLVSTTSGVSLTTSAAVVLTLPSITIPAGRTVRLELSGFRITGSTAAYCDIELQRDGVTIGERRLLANTNGTGAAHAVYYEADLSAGSYVWRARAALDAGTGTFQAGATKAAILVADDTGAGSPLS